MVNFDVWRKCKHAQTRLSVSLLIVIGLFALSGFDQSTEQDEVGAIPSLHPTVVLDALEGQASQNRFLRSLTLSSSEPLIVATASSVLSSVHPGKVEGTEITLWDLRTRKLLRTLKVDEDVVSLALSPNGQLIAVACVGEVRLLETGSGKLVRVLRHRGSRIVCVAFGFDGKSLAVGYGLPLETDSGEIELWDIQTGERIRTLTGHKGGVYSIAFSSDGKTLAAGSLGEIRVWEVEKGRLVHVFQTASREVYSLAFSPDGRWLATASYRELKLWNLSTGQLHQELAGFNDWVHSVAFSPDSRWLASGGIRREGSAVFGELRLWNLQTGQWQRIWKGSMPVMSVAFRGQHAGLIGGSLDGRILFFSVEEMQSSEETSR